MKYILLFMLVAHLASGQNDAKVLIERSIKFHDPNENWHSLKAEIAIASVVDRKGKIDSSFRRLTFDLAKNLFTMTQDTIVYRFPCEDCERAEMYNNYFRYLLGMPMKLRDPGTVIHEDITNEEYNDREYKVVKVTYRPEVGSDTWKFYFNPENASLDLIEFSKDGTFQNGETIELNEKKRFQGMLLPGQLKWFILPDRIFLAEENIKYQELEK